MMLLVNEKGIEQPGGSDGEGVAVVLANPLDPAPGGFVVGYCPNFAAPSVLICSCG
jgi:hypothetical protein